MAGFFDNAELEIPYGHCGRTTKRPVGTLQNNPNLTCPHCGTVTKIHASQFRQTLGGVDKAIKDIQRKLRK
jgi:hypothetical protein